MRCFGAGEMTGYKQKPANFRRDCEVSQRLRRLWRRRVVKCLARKHGLGERAGADGE